MFFEHMWKRKPGVKAELLFSIGSFDHLLTTGFYPEPSSPPALYTYTLDSNIDRGSFQTPFETPFHGPSG
jgi:hypothetical protein